MVEGSRRGGSGVGGRKGDRRGLDIVTRIMSEKAYVHMTAWASIRGFVCHMDIQSDSSSVDVVFEDIIVEALIYDECNKHRSTTCKDVTT